MRIMSRRKRVETTLEHKEPDRVPWDCSLSFETYDNVKKFLGLKVEGKTRFNLWLTAEHEMDVIEALDIDLYYVGLKKPKNIQSFDPDNDSYIDEFGVTFRKTVSPNGRFTFNPYDAEAPLKDATIKDIGDYPWPDPRNPEQIEGLRDKVKYLYQHTDFAIVGKFDIPPFTQAMFMRGAQKWLMDLALNKNFASALLNKLADIAAGFNEVGLEAAGQYLTLLRFSGDDFGSQKGTLISPQTFRDVIKPALRTQYFRSKKAFLKKNPNGKIFNHSCGDVFEIIPDFIDLGLDVLNNLQPAGAMDHVTIKRLYGDRLCFHGGMDVQKVLPFCSLDEVYQETNKCIKNLGPGGGYILAPTIHVQGDVPPENIIAMRDAIKKWGQYPLRF
ncbi:MAG: uroporphyrinogen decarboxylase [Spirochaetes bacterium]|nr:uroporphyrinogen decarboxylase [Spirochaetota bacterium]